MTHEIRVHELAKLAGVKSADMLAGVQELGIDIKSYMSKIGGDDLDFVCDELNIDLGPLEEMQKNAAAEKEKTARKTAKKPVARKSAKTAKSPAAKPHVAAKSKTAATDKKKSAAPAAAPKKAPAAAKEPAPKKAAKPAAPAAAKPEKHKAPKAEAAPAAKKAAPKVGAGEPAKKAAPVTKAEVSEQPKVQSAEAPKTEPKAEEHETAEPEKAAVEVIHVNKPIVLRDLADKLGVKPRNIIKNLMAEGIFASINQMLDLSAVDVVAKSFGVRLEKDSVSRQAKPAAPKPAVKEVLKPRPPVVTFMGHVDHGKTTLLDYIKKTRVASKEFGGITQHIGAYTVRTKQGTIVFMDTPGHEAFTALRARGANLTDICVLVVAVDDGVMQQTVEALNHARAAGVPIIVALNKIDKPGVNVDVVKRQLLQYDLMPEDLGGEIICVPVSGQTGEGIDHLIEMILLQAEIMELKGAPEKKAAAAVVVESKMCKGQGPVVTVIVKEGTLRTGDAFVCDCFSGKIRTMRDHTGATVKEAGPSYPVEVSGISGVPEPGAVLETVDNEKEAKSISEDRQHERKVGAVVEQEPLTWQEQIRLAGIKELKLIVKSDVQGSLEAIVSALENISSEQVMVKIIHKGVGDVVDSDVMLASASGAGIIGFNVRFDNRIRDIAKRNKVDIRIYRIIYDLTDDIKKIVSGMIEPEEIEIVQGRAEVRQLFKLSRYGNVLGCYVLDGKITRRSRLRVLRKEGEDEEVAGNARIASLKRFKEEVKEVNTGFEFGIKIEGVDNLKPEEIKVGYILEAYIIEAKAPVEQA